MKKTAWHSLRLRPTALCLLLAYTLCSVLPAQTASPEHEFKNPILFADYSDPDIIRVADDYYLIASSFHFVPGIPILHSRDLVHWEIAGHVVSRLKMNDAYNLTGVMRYGRGIWAPAVRFNNGLFYVYFPTPDEGIFVATAPKMTGPWTEPETVLAGPGYEDPCPFWDDDGQAYLVHSKLGAGPLILHRMSPDGKHLLDAGKIIVQDPIHLPTLEGPKLYKRNGWYYIFAPKGGVAIGDQVVLRSKNIYGPYDWRVVLAQGNTAINGPHQGGLVDTPDGSNWFLHFQQRAAHGRINWLEPVIWKDDWPLMGSAAAHNAPSGTVGEPVLTAELPLSPRNEARPQTSDDFSSGTLSPMWEWNHNPDDARWSLTEHKGFLRLHPGFADGLLQAHNTLTETMQDESLQVTTRIKIAHMTDGDHVGLSAFDRNLSGIEVIQAEGQHALSLTSGGHDLPTTFSLARNTPAVQLRLQIAVDTVTYSYSTDDGKTFHTLGDPLHLIFSWWKGARPALFAFNTREPSNGYVDFDWVHHIPLTPHS
jgi:beta-xylosidase